MHVFPKKLPYYPSLSLIIRLAADCPLLVSPLPCFSPCSSRYKAAFTRSESLHTAQPRGGSREAPIYHTQERERICSVRVAYSRWLGWAFGDRHKVNVLSISFRHLVSFFTEMCVVQLWCACILRCYRLFMSVVVVFLKSCVFLRFCQSLGFG